MRTSWSNFAKDCTATHTVVRIYFTHLISSRGRECMHLLHNEFIQRYVTTGGTSTLKSTQPCVGSHLIRFLAPTLATQVCSISKWHCNWFSRYCTAHSHAKYWDRHAMCDIYSKKLHLHTAKNAAQKWHKAK